MKKVFAVTTFCPGEAPWDHGGDRLDRARLSLEGEAELENGLRILLSVALPLLCEGVLAEDPEPVRARYQSYLTILERGMLR